MKKIKVTQEVNVYSFDELGDDEKIIAANSMRDFCIESAVNEVIEPTFKDDDGNFIFDDSELWSSKVRFIWESGENGTHCNANVDGFASIGEWYKFAHKIMGKEYNGSDIDDDISRIVYEHMAFDCCESHCNWSSLLMAKQFEEIFNYEEINMPRADFVKIGEIIGVAIEGWCASMEEEIARIYKWYDTSEAHIGFWYAKDGSFYCHDNDLDNPQLGFAESVEIEVLS